MYRVIKTKGKGIYTERLDIVPSVEEHDLEKYKSDLLRTNDFYFQFGEPYSDDLFEAIDFHSTSVIYYSLFLKDTKTMIGYLGVLPYEHEPASGEVEFYIFRDFRRMGYCREALTAYIDSFFSGFLTGVKGESVEAETHYDNEATQNLLKSIGFEKMGVGFKFFLDDGKVETTSSLSVRRFVLKAESFYEKVQK